MNKFLKLGSYAGTFLKRVIREPQLLLNPGYILSRIKKYGQFENYDRYVKRFKLTGTEIQSLQLQTKQFEVKPFVSILLLPGTGSGVNTIESLNSQAYRVGEIIDVSAGGFSSIKTEIIRAAGDYIVFVKQGDILYPNSLFDLVAYINKNKEYLPDILFSDHDNYCKEKREGHFFKPGWSPDLFLVFDYLFRACLVKRLSLLKVLDGEFAEDTDLALYDILLRVSENGKVVHCPGVLFSFPKTEAKTEPEQAGEKEKNIRLAALQRRGGNSTVSANKHSLPMVRRNLMGEPLISIIIPTCFKEDYISTCISSILSKSTYRNYEIIVLDNSRKGPDYGKQRLKDFDCRIVYIDKPFNWAEFNNIAVQHASGELYLFLNDDTEVLTNEWLEIMASHALRQEIGVVGPLLLFPDGVVQHAGMFLVNNSAGMRHCFTQLPEGYSGYHNILHYQRNVIAVSGACQMVAKSKYENVRGYDERFSVGSNDVDFCLRLYEQGYLNLYLPEVLVTHKEKASRANLSEENDNKLFTGRWGKMLAQGDPFFNKYLSMEHSDFRLGI